MRSEYFPDTSGNLCFAGSLLFAYIDPSGLAEYAVKTAIAGLVWLGFRITDRWLEQRRKNKSNKP
jgi:hypothetical protein